MTDQRPLSRLAILTLALGVAIGAAGCGADSSGGAGDSSAAGAESSRATGGAVDIHQLDRIPDVSVADLNGTDHPLRELVGGGPTVVNFWATWCAPCKRELPELAEVHEAIQPGGGRVLGIAVSSGSAEEIRSFAEKHGVDFPIYRASQAWAGRHFGLYGLPTTLVVDATGRVHERLMGPQTRQSLMRHLKPLLEEG